MAYRFSRLQAGALLCCLALSAEAPLHAPARILACSGAPTTAQDAVSRTLSGRVIDAVRGIPIPRALVRVGSRAVLSDALGRFSFPEFTDNQGSIGAYKPGYTASAEGGDNNTSFRIPNLDAPVELQLYPDSLITGVVSGRDGLPVAQVVLSLYRATYTPAGLVPVESGFAQSDSHGQFRFQQPAGRFRVALRYEAQLPATGDAVLPSTVPAEAFNSPLGFMAVGSGQERHVELVADMRPAYPVDLRVEGEAGRGLRVTAQTPDGETFQTQAAPMGFQGQFRTTLPAGAYRLRFTGENDEQPLEGAAQVTVPVRDGSTVALQLAPLADYPIELALDPAADAASAIAPTSGSVQSQSMQLPGLQQLNLQLYNPSDPLSNADMRPRADGRQNFSFRVPAGHYRLTASGTGAWTVRAASAGGTNLMTDELVVGDGAGGVPIRILVANDSGRLDGTVQFVAGETTGWVYLVPRTPSLTGFLLQRINADGSFGRNLPPGSYTAFAVPQKVQQDLLDPRVEATFAASGRNIEITANGKSTVALDMPGPAGGSR
jgi:hypothetical protein